MWKCRCSEGQAVAKKTQNKTKKNAETVNIYDTKGKLPVCLMRSH